MKVNLKIERGPQVGTTFNFTEPDTFLVGRTRQAHLTLSKDDLFVSRCHFLLEVAPPNCFIKDFGSSNGTWVNGNRIERQSLLDGDLIEIGDTSISISIDSEEIEEDTIIDYCEQCGNAIPPNQKKDCALPDCSLICQACADDLEQVTIQREIAFPAYCNDCGTDLTQLANSDGRAEELKDVAIYICSKCADQKKRNADLDRIDDYRIINELGRGGMGAVYTAVHEQTNRLVALKMILKEGLREKAKKRFAREMRIQKKLDHPNIVRLFDVGLHEGKNYFVSEYVTGGDAHQLVQNTGGPLPPQLAGKIIIDTLNGLKYFHEAGNVHRDIKPMNILLAKDGQNSSLRAKLADFGLAKCLAEAGGTTLTRVGEVAGTMLFMAPEQILDFKNVTDSADLYAVGICLYYLLTGQYPFNFPTRIDVIRAMMEKKQLKDPILIVLEDEPEPIRNKNPNIPKKLAKIADKAIMKKKSMRYNSTSDMLDELIKSLDN